jgi:hypothetical protein
MGYTNQCLHVKCPHCYWHIAVSRPSQWAVQLYLSICLSVCLPTYKFTSIPKPRIHSYFQATLYAGLLPPLLIPLSPTATQTLGLNLEERKKQVHFLICSFHSMDEGYVIHIFNQCNETLKSLFVCQSLQITKIHHNTWITSTIVVTLLSLLFNSHQSFITVHMFKSFGV